ncbi:MFS transporter, partial [Litchfieldella qijiaojingensis]|uniref:MFS transporter n=1 Tax=Litchfieldella qijiaojingensis TaxID=980347 RepID=UPI001E4BA25D
IHPGARAPSEPPVPSPQVSISSMLSSLHPLKKWSLRESRGGSILGLKPILIVSSVSLGLSLSLSLVVESIYLMAFLRVLYGIFCGLLVIMGESWVCARGSEKSRGSFVGLYAGLFTGCQLLGPFLIYLFGYESISPTVMICAFIFILSVMILFSRYDEIDFSRGKGSSLLPLILSVPFLVYSVFIFASFDGVVLAMFPAYGVHNGYSVEVAALIITVVFLGDAVTQPLIGWASDRVGHARMHFMCCTVFLISIVLVYLSVGTKGFWFILFILGASGGGIYTLALVRAGDKFNGVSLVAINSVFSFVWGVGSFSGPIAAGFSVDVYGANGLVYFLIGMGMTVVFFNCLSLTRKAGRWRVSINKQGAPRA